MKPFQSHTSLLILLCALLLVSVAHSQVPENKLLPFSYDFDKEVRPLFDQKMLLSGANFGRMIRMFGKPDVGESVVSVSCENSGAKQQCSVTLTKAATNLDYLVAEDRRKSDPLEGVRRVKVFRVNATIPPSIAVAFRNCITELLPTDEVQEQQSDAVTMDGQRVEFWLVSDDGLIRNGQIGDHPNGRIKSLVKIGNSLADYCEAKQAARSAILAGIEREAAAILTSKSDTGE